jgi:hypothetical protein
MFTRGQGPGRRILSRTVAVTFLVLTVATPAASPAAADPGADRSDAPAAGAVQPGSGATSVASTQAHHGTLSAGVVLSADPDGCPITRYGYTGRYVCSHGYRYIDRGGGNEEWFVVGTDFSIWHIWLNSGGWHSLGGLASAFTPNGAYLWFSANGTMGVWTIGAEPERRAWCRAWPWTSGWQLCHTIQPPPIYQY